MKIACFCNHGNVRSAALTRAFKDLNLKDLIKHEAIALGLHCTTPETINMVVSWADKVVDLSDEGEPYIRQNLLQSIAKDKYIRKDIGVDRWGNPFNGELREIANKIRDEILK
jgi:hypothetical protein